MNISDALRSEYSSLAQQYQALSIPICIYSSLPEVLAHFVAQMRVNTRHVVTNVTQMSTQEQDALADTITKQETNYVFCLEKDPFILVKEQVLSKKLALLLMQAPLEIVTP